MFQKIVNTVSVIFIFLTISLLCTGSNSQGVSMNQDVGRAVEGEMPESFGPASRLSEVTMNSSNVLIGDISSYKYIELDEKNSPQQFIIFHVDINQHIVKVGASNKIQLWIGGLEGPSGLIFVSDNPHPTVGEKAILFLKHEPALGKDAYIPASDEWSYLPIRNETTVVMPTGVVFTLDQVLNMITKKDVP